jgi:hypothetical protein
VVDTDSVPTMHTEPSEDLLASLTRYTQGREGATGSIPAVPDQAAPGLPTRAPGTGSAIPTRGDIGTTAPPLPPHMPGIPTRGDIGAGAAARGAPGQGAGAAPAGPGGPGNPPPAWLTATPPPAPPPPRRPATTGSNSTLGSLLAGLSQPGFSPGPPASGHAPPAPPPGGGAGVTSGGLTRRVRGAQMPTTNPVAVRRPSSGPDPAAPPPPGRTPPPTRSADAVYSFLTNFSAGVQRGLDETRR